MHPLDTLSNLRVNRVTILTIGVFDGVHRGHQHLIGGTVHRARQLQALAGVLTFYPHPQLVLAPSNPPVYLTTLQERLALISALDVDIITTLPFTKELAQVTAADFVSVLSRTFRLIELRVGPDFTLGHRRQGTIPVLRELGRAAGFDVVAVPLWEMAGAVVSSTRIRQLIRQGQVDQAAQLLGRAYELSGRVAVGDRRGRTLGFPTANLEIDRQMLLPSDGVYAVSACVAGQLYPAVCNIGLRPSFGGLHRTFEVHLLDYDGDLYGQTVTVRFTLRLRGEVRFPDVNALVRQIEADVKQAREVLDAVSAAPCS